MSQNPATGTLPLGESPYGGATVATKALAPQNYYVPTPQWLTQTLLSYLYVQYADDANLQAFVNSYNGLTQQFLNWFIALNLPIYTVQSGGLLDWVGTGLYGIQRPILSTLSQTFIQGYGEGIPAERAFGTRIITESGTAQLASDDVYKRVLTWHLWKGDGFLPSIPWLRTRIARFLYGINGGPNFANAGRNNVQITLSSDAFTITVPNTTMGTVFQTAVNDGLLALPFQNTYTVNLA